MKKFTKTLAMFLMGTVLVGFTACSNDNGDDNGSTAIDPVKNYPSAAPASMEEVAKVYVNDVIKPTYKDLAKAAEALSEKSTALYTKIQDGTLTDDDMNAACEAFKTARYYWEQSEAFLYGAAEDKNVDPHIDDWPLDQASLTSLLNNSKMIAGFKGSDPAKFVYDNHASFSSVLGFHGMEFILFRDGKNRTAAALKANETFTGMTSVKGEDELAFLSAVGQDLRNMCYLLEISWLGTDEADASHVSHVNNNCAYLLSDSELVPNGYYAPKGNKQSYSQYLLASTTTDGWFQTWQLALNNVFVGGCSNISQEVYTQKLGQAYRVATGQGGTTEDGEKESIDYIESPYSKRSFKDYQDNIYSIKHTLYGTRDDSAEAPVQNSLLNYLQKNGYEGTADLSSALNDALKALGDAFASGTAFVDDPKNPQVKTCIDKVQKLDNEVNAAGAWIAKQR